MSQTDLLEELRRLPPAERLRIVEAALKEIEADMRTPGASEVGKTRRERLVAAARALLPDYVADRELTAFTALDGDEIHAPRCLLA